MDDFFDFMDDVAKTTSDLFDETVDTLGNAWDSLSIMRGPPNQQYNASQKVFQNAGEGGYRAYNLPKMKYSFITVFELSVAARQFIQSFLPATHGRFNAQYVSYFVKDTDLPSMNFEIERVNQYNRSRIVSGKTEYTPVNITFFDTVDSSALLLFDAYRQFYYGDNFAKNLNSYNNDIVSSPSFFEGLSGNWGRVAINSGEFDNNYFFKRITIYEIDNDTYTCHSMHNAYVQSFQPDTKSHDSDGEPSVLTMTLEYEFSSHIGAYNQQEIAQPTTNIMDVVLATYKQSGFYKLFGEMDDKVAGLGSMGNILRAGGSIYDISSSVGDILSGNTTPDTIRDLGSAIMTGSNAIGFGDATSNANGAFGLGNILGDF